MQLNESSSKVFVVNEMLEHQTGTLKLKLQDFYGNELWSKNAEISVDKSSSNVYTRIPEEIYKGKRTEVVLEARFNDASVLHYFSKPKNLMLPKAELNYQITKVEEGYKIEITSEVLQKKHIFYANQKGHFSDNFFDLIPNQKKTILFKNLNNDKLQIKSKTFNTLMR